MKLTDIHKHETDIRDGEHLEELLTEAPSVDGYEAFVICSADGDPQLWIKFNQEIAYPHYFHTTDGSHPGYQPKSEDRPEHSALPRTVTFLQVGASWADRIEVPRETTVSKRTAIVIAKEFIETQQLPKCILWLEL